MHHSQLSLSTFHKIFEVNTVGHDYIVGDIHGAFNKLREHLEAIGFNPIKDRLFSVGDLVDRNSGSVEARHWIQQPFFHCVRGNHEDMFLNWRADPEKNKDYIQPWNGGEWALKADEEELQKLEEALKNLPYILSVPLSNELWVAVAHADIPNFPVAVKNSSIEKPLSRELLCQEMVLEDFDIKDEITWNRNRLLGAKEGNPYPVNFIEGYDLVVVGHTTINESIVLGQFVYLDTGGWLEGRPFTIRKLLNLAQTIQTHETKYSKKMQYLSKLEI